VTLRETDEILWFNDGVYNKYGNVLIAQTAENTFHYDLGMKHLTEIKGHIMRQTYRSRDEFDADLNIINVSNKLYNIQTGQFTEHTPNYLSMNQKPIVFDPNAKPKLFGKFLSTLIYPSDVRTLVELMAYTFYRDNPFEIITTLYGSGSNGKSVLFGILAALHGAANVSNVSLKTIIERPFGLFDLVGKDCNLDSELSSGVIEDTAILKKITGRQLIRVEQKNQKAFDARIYAKEWLSANTIPQTTDDTPAFYRRNIIISCPNIFEEEENKQLGIRRLDPELLRKLTTDEELAGIFNVLMIALRRILKNGKIFVNEKTIEQRRERYEMAANSVHAFINKAVDVESMESDLTTKETAYRAYKHFCKLNKLAAISKEKVGKVLKNTYAEARARLEDDTRPPCWRGMKLLPIYIRWLDDNPEQKTLKEYADPEELR
jgi:P4 family phage/plasmid primase-like protien